MVRLLSIALSAIIAMVLSAQMMMPEQSDGSKPATEHSADETGKTRATYYSDTASRTVLHRDSSGQFHIDGRVNGEEARFLIDTGADVVALTLEDAEAMNVEFSQSQFEEVARTASGPGMGQQVMIDHLEVGGMEFTNVPAMVVEGLDTNLLGQSVLRRMGKVELTGDRMVIHKG